MASRRYQKRKQVKQKQAMAKSSAPLTNVNDFGGARTTKSQLRAGDSVPRRVRKDLSLDERKLNTLPVERLMDLLIDAHPDVGFALWNFLRIGNTDYIINVKKLNSDGEFTQGKKIIDQFIQALSMPNPERYEINRSLDNLINQLLLTTVTRGAASLETVLGQSMSGVAFLAPIDPATIEFKFENDRFIPYQDSLSLDIPTFFYEALDPLIDSPTGRSPFLNAIQTVMFQLQLLNDIKAVVHNQGYPRLDIKILEELVIKRMPPHVKQNEEKKRQYLQEKLQEIITMYEQLEADTTFVHYDSVEMGMVGGKSGGGGAMFDVEKLMGVIDGLLAAALKTLTTILGRRSTGNTESFAKLEVKMYLKSVKALQDVVAKLLSRAFTLLLNLNGKQGIVEFKFREADLRSELEKAQFEQIHLLNCQFKYNMGWWTADEAAQAAVGHSAVSDPIHNVVPTNKDGQTPKGSTDNNPKAGGSSG
ncbi:hypothetical protein DFP93_101225 [Aneurinibacillus soli]|uniref:Uncharacterized protein n=1 Tax=Aneurinibacillus soli TaxID=1500254 RepID=A0A0U5AWM6_9BACL|nr:hypothetical protein [Aneurinibacillus soli]PYE64200.1 hypothetical protein DFP93_101225 [Aneurinibacillus soli]BAU28149.1 hypothetical protein CB4_02323 [Aneurinibacillus soli]